MNLTETIIVGDAPISCFEDFHRFFFGVYGNPMNHKESNRLNQVIERGSPLQFTCDEKPMTAYEGETVAGALIAQGIHALRKSEKRGEYRGVFCGMGICFECRMVINGRFNIRACVTAVEPGMVVETQTGPRPD